MINISFLPFVILYIVRIQEQCYRYDSLKDVSFECLSTKELQERFTNKIDGKNKLAPKHKIRQKHTDGQPDS